MDLPCNSEHEELLQLYRQHLDAFRRLSNLQALFFHCYHACKRVAVCNSTSLKKATH